MAYLQQQTPQAKKEVDANANPFGQNLRALKSLCYASTLHLIRIINTC